MPDELVFEILEDGRAVVAADEISMPNHVTAENVLNFISKLTGVAATRKARTDAKKHTHGHTHKVKQ